MTLKRKESDDDSDFEEEQKSPKRAYIKPRQEVWQPLNELKEKSRTSGVIPRLKQSFTHRGTVNAYLCSPSTDHITTGFMDLGWGCGYRNCQMLMSFLERHEQDGDYLLKHVPDITGLQVLIEEAWKEGFDPSGAAQLKHSVLRTRKWIGTTEVYTLLAYLGIRSTIIDFHNPGPGKLHTKLMDWVQSYFMEGESNEHVHITNKPPLYLQHQGHSRTIIGIEVLKSGKRNLIMFDPGRRTLRSYRMNHRKEEGVSSSSGHHHRHFFSRIKNSFPSALLRPYRVDEKAISKNKQYQILVLGQVDAKSGLTWNGEMGYILKEEQREMMKTVTSLTL
ncbi:DUF1671-domain-containing protein [Backusella circina FSU 941]|nr:DUF1671-domain-containing protein [Backusella circina FSU 941]